MAAPRGLILSLTLAALLAPASAEATWSIVAVDQRTGTVVIASATCVTSAGLARLGGLMGIQAVIVPGKGVAAAQAAVDASRQNQMLIYAELRKGTPPADILARLREDPRIESRQFGIVDLQGRTAGFSGRTNGPASLDVQGQVPGTGIFYSIQGNILRSDDVVNAAASAFRAAGGSLTDRAMAAMEAADREGGDSRCSCDRGPAVNAPCTAKTAHVAYLVRAEPDDPTGESHSDGKYSLVLTVTDQDIQPDEDANPVRTLRRRYERVRQVRQVRLVRQGDHAVTLSVSGYERVRQVRHGQGT